MPLFQDLLCDGLPAGLANGTSARPSRLRVRVVETEETPMKRGFLFPQPHTTSPLQVIARSIVLIQSLSNLYLTGFNVVPCSSFCGAVGDLLLSLLNIPISDYAQVRIDAPLDMDSMLPTSVKAFTVLKGCSEMVPSSKMSGRSKELHGPRRTRTPRPAGTTV